jgi:osmotically-inducible protein OsmY
MTLEHTIPPQPASAVERPADSSDCIVQSVERAVSDEAVRNRQLQEAAQRRLDSTGYQILKRSEVHVDGGTVRLTGRVLRYYHKAVATAAILRLDGVTNLKNELQVSPR